jgi:hypothetical protein
MAACGTPTPPTHQEWDASKTYQNQPVYDIFKGVSVALHKELLACGLTDQDANDAVNKYNGLDHLQNPDPWTTTKFTFGSDGSITSGEDITIKAIAAGVDLVACKKHVAP